MTEQQMIDTIQQLAERVAALEREVTILQNVNKMTRKESGSRVYVAEVARRFGVSSATIHRMRFDFAGLAAIKKTTQTGRVYFERKEYEKWLAVQEGKQPRRKLTTRRRKSNS